MSVKPIPEGYHSITPYLVIKGAKEALSFYQEAFSAQVMLVLNMPDGNVAHAEMIIGNSPFMLSEECGEEGFDSPLTLGGSATSMMVYTEDVDTLFQQAVDVGCEIIRPVQDQFYGDRTGTLKDPFGHIWVLATHKEDLTEEQLNQRMADFIASQA